MTPIDSGNRISLRAWTSRENSGMIGVTVSTCDGAPGLLVLAVDDEPLGLDGLTDMLGQNQHIGRVIPAMNASDVLGILGGADEEVAKRRATNQPAVDAAFVDINMPGINGVDLGRVLLTLEPKPALVFVTGIGEEAVTAYEMGATDYLLKPLKQDRLDLAVTRVRMERELADSPPVTSPAGAPDEPADVEVIPVELAGSTKLIPRSKVRYVEAQGDYARLYTNEGSHLVRIPLAQLEERWSNAGFVRIHRSYLVALSLVTELKMGPSGYQVIIGDNERVLPVSRRHTRDLKDKLVRAPKNSWGGA